MMKLSISNYQNEDDYFRIRAFLRQVFLLNDRRERSWQPYRFDYWRWHVNKNINHRSLEEVIFLWETEDGQIAAVLNPEGSVDAHFQVHPAFRTPELEEEMLDVAEAHLAAPGRDGVMKLVTFALELDEQRRSMYKRRGYTKQQWMEYQRRRLLSMPVPGVQIAEGYTIRSLGGPEELPSRSWASWRAFHPDEPDEKYESWEWYRNVQRCPLYRRDLDVVAIAPDGEVAAFCTVWFDDVTRTGAFEPVGTMPEHQRRGLGKAIMYEAMRRVELLGGTLVTVQSDGDLGHLLYNATGFTDYNRAEVWLKTF